MFQVAEKNCPFAQMLVVLLTDVVRTKQWSQVRGTVRLEI